MTDREPDLRLDAFPREIEPPAGSLGAITARLSREGLIREPGPRHGRWLRVAAMLAIGFAAGWGASRAASAPGPSATTSDRYILLLYGAPAADRDERVAEYREWAARTRRDGRLVSGERLAAWSRTIGPEVDGGRISGPSGYFVIEAASEAEAEALAASHPHVRHGGTIVVRRIDPT